MKRGDNVPRDYDLSLSKEFNISRHRYRELKEFCLQYGEKKEKLRQLYSLSSAQPDVAVMGGEPGKPTERKAISALQLKNDMEIIDEALKDACGADVGLLPLLKKNVTEGVGFDRLGYVPCSIRNFYQIRRKFFFLLDKEKK